MKPTGGNRAVSALFRVFAAMRIGMNEAEASEVSSRVGMHDGERLFLAVLIPLTVLVAIGESLALKFGLLVAGLLTLPAAFLALNLLPYLLNTRSLAWQWRGWLIVLSGWGLYRIQDGGVDHALAWMWIWILALNTLAVGILAVRRILACHGRVGVAWRLMFAIALHAAGIAMGFNWGWVGAILGAALASGFCCGVVLWPGCQFLGPVLCSRPGEEILITIDDGPDPVNTPRLLDLLDEYGAKAVFFMIGEKVRNHPELVREVLRRGHELGNHTMTHPQASFWCAGPWRTRREIENCQEMIHQAAGIRPIWFRAPVGHRNWFTHPVTGALGMKVMAWNRRGYDGVEKNATLVLSRILPGLGTGDIVLIHENTVIAEKVLRGILMSIR